MTTTSKIKNTPWAKRFWKECPTAYDAAIRIAPEDPCVVYIDHDEHKATGEWKWAIVSEQEPGFWLDAFDTEEEAWNLVNEMEWVEIK